MEKYRFKYVLGSIILGFITLFSALKPEKYSSIIPVMFSIFTIISIVMIFIDKKELKKM